MEEATKKGRTAGYDEVRPSFRDSSFNTIRGVDNDRFGNLLSYWTHHLGIVESTLDGTVFAENLGEGLEIA